MGRPRRYDLDVLHDHARRLWIDKGIDDVTMRALSTESGASNGAVYHAFGSRSGLLARVWSTEAQKFLTFQRSRVVGALRDGDPVSALVTAALTPASYALEDADGARLLLSTNADRLMTPELDAEAEGRLRRLQRDLGALLIDLAEAMWGRRDRAAVTAVQYCVVDLPAALLLKNADITDPLARHVLEHAVRGIASAPPPVNGRASGRNAS